MPKQPVRQKRDGVLTYGAVATYREGAKSEFWAATAIVADDGGFGTELGLGGLSVWQ